MPEEKKYWLDSSANVTKLFRGLWCVGIALLLADVFLVKHEDFTLSALLGFYGFYGFFACCALVLTAKALRRVLMRSEDYYER